MISCCIVIAEATSRALSECNNVRAGGRMDSEDPVYETRGLKSSFLTRTAWKESDFLEAKRRPLLSSLVK